MNLAEWAESQVIAGVTAYRWFRAGELPVPARKVGGLILVDPRRRRGAHRRDGGVRASVFRRSEVRPRPAGCAGDRLGHRSGNLGGSCGDRGWLASEYGHVVIEDLDVAAMKRSMGRRAFRRAVSDAAMGLVRPQLAYKTARHGVTLTVADRWFASSQIHHGCLQSDGSPCRLESKRDSGKITMDKVLRCPITGEDVDRDINAARNLRDWPELPVDAQSGRHPRPSAVPGTALETAAQTVGTTDRLGSSPKTTRHTAAASDEGRTKATPNPVAAEPRKRSA